MHPISFRDGDVTVRGLRLHYIDYGGKGETVVALHGLSQSARAFDSVAPLLVPRFHLIALDLRGRGESEWGPAERYRMDVYLKDLRDFLNELGLDRVALIGTSLGGWVSRMFATAYPERVTRLVLNDCAIGGNLTGFHRVAVRASRAPAEFPDFAAALSWFASEHPGLDQLAPDIQRNWVAHYLTETASGGLRFKCDPAVFKMAESLANHIVGLKRPNVEPALAWEQVKRLTMPVLLLRGALSDVIPEETSARLAQILPQARTVEIPGVSHSPTLYEPESQTALAEFFGVLAPAKLAVPAAAE